MSDAPEWVTELWEWGWEHDLSEEAIPAWARYPALGQVTISHPQILRAFRSYNDANPEHRIRPGNFVSVAFPKPLSRLAPIRLFAPYVSDPSAALRLDWFELHSGLMVRITTEHQNGAVAPQVIPVMSYGEVACRHLNRPEAKFQDRSGRAMQNSTGHLLRRRVLDIGRERIGKEANALHRRNEGPDVTAEAQESYQMRKGSGEPLNRLIREANSAHLALASGLSARAVREIQAGRSVPRAENRLRLLRAARHLGNTTQA